MKKRNPAGGKDIAGEIHLKCRQLLHRECFSGQTHCVEVLWSPGNCMKLYLPTQPTYLPTYLPVSISIYSVCLWLKKWYHILVCKTPTRIGLCLFCQVFVKESLVPHPLYSWIPRVQCWSSRWSSGGTLSPVRVFWYCKFMTDSDITAVVSVLLSLLLCWRC